MSDDPQETFDDGDEAALAQVQLDPLEYKRAYLEHARLTGEGIVPQKQLLAEAAQLRKEGHHETAMEVAIRAQSSRVVEAPPQLRYSDLPLRLQAELTRRQMAAERPKP